MRNKRRRKKTPYLKRVYEWLWKHKAIVFLVVRIVSKMLDFFGKNQNDGE